MLEFLQTGKALSVLAAIGLVGLVSKLITQSLYKRLLKETENMAMTRNKNLKILKQKVENTYRLNQNIVNTQAYLDKLIYGFRFMHLSLEQWNSLSFQMILLGLFAGGLGSFFSYWYRLDSYYIVLYATAAVLGGLFLAFVDCSAQIGQKKQQLETVLLEYVDNSVFVRAAREGAAGREPAGSGKSGQAVRDRERLIRENEIRDGLVHEEEGRRLQEEGAGQSGGETAGRCVVRPLRGRSSKAEELLRTVRSMKEEEADRPEETESSYRGTVQREKADRARARSAVQADMPRDGVEGHDGTAERQPDHARRNLDYLRQSLDQIAASRDRGRDGTDWTRNLSSEEAKLLGEIMREYFSGS